MQRDQRGPDGGRRTVNKTLKISQRSVDNGPKLRRASRFSRSGDPTIEALYRTHRVSQELSERKQQRRAEKASRAPELVVVQPLNREWKCHRCGKTGDLLMMENPARRAWVASVSTISRSCRRATPCRHGAPRRTADDMPSSCASAERAAATNDRACWSSLRRWRRSDRVPRRRHRSLPRRHWSGRRESNPRMQLGKLPFYH